MYTNEEDNDFKNELSSDDFDVEDDKKDESMENKSSPLKIIIIAVLLIVLVVFAILIFGNTKKAPLLSDKNKTININESFTLTLNTNGNKVTNLMFVPSDENIVSVVPQANGAQVTGKNYGKSIINVNYNIGDKKTTVQCQVTVVGGKSGVNLSSVSFPDGVLLLSMGKEYHLTPTFEPSDGYITSLKYSSDNGAIAYVDNNGSVKGLTVGATNIQVTVNDSITASIPVMVISEDTVPGIVIPPTSFSFKDTNSIKVTSGDSITLEINKEPSDANEDLIEWKSSDINVAIIKKGILLGVNEGKATITAKYGDIVISKDVVVIGKEVKITGINVTNSEIDVKYGDFGSIEYNIEPSNATVKDVLFKSSDVNVAMVDTNGVITGTGEGECTITITSLIDSSISTNVKVIVTK